MPFSRSFVTVRSLTALASTAVVLATVAACTTNSSASTVSENGATVVRYQGYPSQVLPPELAQELGFFEHIELEWVGNVNGGPEQLQGVASKSTDFGGAFNGAIVKLRDSGAKVKSVFSYYGADEQTNSSLVVLDDSPIHSARDLIGRSIGVNTLGAQSEFTVRLWLEQEGLTPEEIEQVQLRALPAGTSEQVLRQEQIDSVLIGTVLFDLAQQRGGLRVVFNDAELLGGESLGSIAVRDEYIENNPEAVADLVQGSARAIRWAQLSPVEEVQTVLTKILTERDGADAAALVPLWKSIGISTPGGVIQEQEFTRWAQWLGDHNELRSGNVTSSDLFTNEFNPYSNGTFAPDADENGK